MLHCSIVFPDRFRGGFCRSSLTYLQSLTVVKVLNLLAKSDVSVRQLSSLLLVGHKYPDLV